MKPNALSLLEWWYTHRLKVFWTLVVLVLGVVIWLTRPEPGLPTPEPSGPRPAVTPTGSILTPGPDGVPDLLPRESS